MPRVLVCDPLEATGIELLTQAGIEVDNQPGLFKKGVAALQAALQQADGCIVRSETRLTAEILESPGKLRAVVRAGVGVDTIDVTAATRKGVVVMNTPSGNTISTAEHTIAMMLSLAHRIPEADASMKAGKWDRKKFLGTQVAGKTLGIIGAGRIGREVAKRALGLDMKVLCLDPYLTHERAAQLGIEAVESLEWLLPRCDFLTVHTPLTKETKGMIGAKELELLPKTARILNVARGGIIDEQALADALMNGCIAGAAIDVFSQEPITPDNPLLKAPNTVLTPHLGASTAEAQDAVAREAAQLLIDFLLRGVVSCAVNMAAIDRAELEEMRPYVDLARRLGLLHAQMDQGAIQQVNLHYSGDLARRNTRLLTAAFMAGLLEYRLAEGANIVNAEVIARERGIEITQTNTPTRGDFTNVMQADVVTDKKTYTASGTVFGKQTLRLVQVGPYRMDGSVYGIILLFTHRDVPGLIGFIGTIFGKYNVNIAQMTVGRQQPGGEAIAALNLDSPPPEEAIKEVRTHPQISSLSVVKLPPADEMPTWFA